MNGKRCVATVLAIACAAAFLALGSGDAKAQGSAAVTRQRYGNTDRYSDSSSVRTSGQRRYSSDGTTYTTVGNKVFGSDGSIATTYGDKTFTTGPGMSMTVGTKSADTTYYTGGTYGLSRTAGSTTYYDLFYPKTYSESSYGGRGTGPSGSASGANNTSAPSQGLIDLYRMDAGSRSSSDSSR